MNTFEFYAPTRVVFGIDTEEKTGKLVREYGGSKVLIVYGGGSAKRSGLIDKVEASLAAEGIDYKEFGGVQPNPLLSYAEEGVRTAIQFGADFMLAVGGGSAIDTAKAIAHGTANPDAKLWDIWTKKVPLTKSLPIAAVLTIPAAGSEMSNSAVLTNTEIGRKAGIGTDLNRCRFAIMDPTYCLTLPPYQKAAGITDIMMHTLDRYFVPGSDCQLTDEIAEGLLRTVIENGRRIMADSNDISAMGEVMWCSSLSHNDLTGCGRARDFSVHKLGHELSAAYGVTHGASLSSVWKAWALYLYEDCLDRFSRYARKVWGITDTDDKAAALSGIEATVAYFKEIGMPTSLAELGVQPTDEELAELGRKATVDDTLKLSQVKSLGAKEVTEIYKNALLS